MVFLLLLAAAQDPFTVVLIPDTQYYSEKHPKIYLAQTEWIKKRAKPDNIKFAIHLGDIVQNDTIEEWKIADRAHKIIDGIVPYSMVPGNHDMAHENGSPVRICGGGYKGSDSFFSSIWSSVKNNVAEYW